MKKNPYIAPIVIALLFILYFAFYGYMSSMLTMHFAAKVIFIAIPVVMIITMICVLIERIKEIRKGENDDLGKY